VNEDDGSPVKSIYDLVKQEIDMPEGLQYRGKYASSKPRPLRPQTGNSKFSSRNQEINDNVAPK
jgi:hypothetical protein